MCEMSRNKPRYLQLVICTAKNVFATVHVLHLFLTVFFEQITETMKKVELDNKIISY